MKRQDHCRDASLNATLQKFKSRINRIYDVQIVSWPFPVEPLLRRCEGLCRRRFAAVFDLKQQRVAAIPAQQIKPAGVIDLCDIRPTGLHGRNNLVLRGISPGSSSHKGKSLEKNILHSLSQVLTCLGIYQV